jgi:cytochrome-b5 reductase
MELEVVGVAVGVALVVAFVVSQFFKSHSTSAALVPAQKAKHKKEAQKTFLNRERQQVTLTEKIVVSHDTVLFRFGLPTKDTVLGLPIGKHLKVFAPNVLGVKEGEWNGRPDPEAGKPEIFRPYTPTSSDDDAGHFDLVIKVYHKGVKPPFPDGGKLSQYLDSLKVGDHVNIAGPFGLIEYLGHGVFSVSRKERPRKKEIGMIAGGTGITPMLQIISAVLKDPTDESHLSLLFANQTEEDILLRDMLEDLASKHAHRLKIWYTLDRPSPEWKYSLGFVTEEMIRDHLPKAGSDSCVLLCGPPPMIKYACEPNLAKLGFEKDDILVF